MIRPGRISLFVGMVTGAITGLLFAPSKGEELRKNIAKERQSGGIGHKAIAQDISKMGQELGDLLQKVAKSDEAKRFWAKTNNAVEDWTGGAVELDEWTKQAQTKITQLGQAVNKYAEEQRYLLTGAKKAVKKVKAAAKKVAASKSGAKKSGAKKPVAQKVPASKAPASKKPAAKKPASKKPTAKKSTTSKPSSKKK